MIQLTQSAFLHALGHAIINSLWQFALLWLVYILITGPTRLSSHAKYVTGLACQFAGFGWFVLTLVFYFNQYVTSPTVSQEATAGLGGLSGSPTLREQLFVVLLKTEQFLPYISLAYLGLLLLLTVKWLQAFNQTNRIRSTGLMKIDVEWRLFVQRLAGQMGIKHPVRIYLSNLIPSPVTIGYFKPVILVPLASVNHLSTQQMEAVLLHELAHIKRMDYLVNIILSIVEAVLFFNPFMQLISRQVKKERENSCDDWVLQYEYNAATYAHALLKLATTHARPMLAMHASPSQRGLLNRVKRMVEQKDNHFSYRHQLLAFLFLAGLLSSVAWLAPGHYPAGGDSVVSTSTTMVPVVAKVDNPLFNPVFLLAEKSQIKAELEKAGQQVQQWTVVIKHEGVAVTTETISPAQKPLRFHVQNKCCPVKQEHTSQDSLFHEGLNTFLTATFWNELEQAEKEMKLAHFFINTATQPIKIEQSQLAIIDDVETGLERVRKMRQQLLETTARTERSRELTQMKSHIREFAAHSVLLKTQAENWNKQLKELNKELLAPSLADVAFKTGEVNVQVAHSPSKGMKYNYVRPAVAVCSPASIPGDEELQRDETRESKTLPCKPEKPGKAERKIIKIVNI